MGELVSEATDDIHRERFSSTPYGLFLEMFESVRIRQHAEASTLSVIKCLIQEGVRNQIEGESDSDSCVEESFQKDPDPDGFVKKSSRLPKGFSIVTAHAETVLLDRTRSLLDAHYDEVFLLRWKTSSKRATADNSGNPAQIDVAPSKRPRACRVDPKVLEARLSQRFELRHCKRFSSGSGPPLSLQ